MADLGCWLCTALLLWQLFDVGATCGPTAVVSGAFPVCTFWTILTGICLCAMYVFLSKCIVMSCMQVPGSHQLELSPQRLQVAAGRLFAGYGYAAGDPQRLMPNCTVLCGPAGSATLIDTRIWHVSAVSYWRRCKPPQYMHA